MGRRKRRQVHYRIANRERPPTRFVTDRTLAFGELYQETRSRDYSVGAIELNLTADGKGSSGTVLPACKLTLDKKKQQIEIETCQNPWNLTNFIIHND